MLLKGSVRLVERSIEEEGRIDMIRKKTQRFRYKLGTIDPRKVIGTILFIYTVWYISWIIKHV